VKSREILMAAISGTRNVPIDNTKSSATILICSIKDTVGLVEGEKELG